MRYYGMSSQGGKRTETVETAENAEMAKRSGSAVKTAADGFLNPKLQSGFENNRRQNAARETVRETAEAAETSAAAEASAALAAADEAEDAATLHALQRTGAAARQETGRAQFGKVHIGNAQSGNPQTGSAQLGDFQTESAQFRDFQTENTQLENPQTENESFSRWLENQPRAIFPPKGSDINIRLPQNEREIGAGVGIGNSGDGAEREENYPLNGNGYSDSREKNDYIRNIGDIDPRGAAWSRSSANICPITDKNDEYLCRAAGKFVKVEFFGGAPSSEKSGTLKYVGNDYIVIEEGGSRNSVMCAMKNINTVTVYG